MNTKANITLSTQIKQRNDLIYKKMDESIVILDIEKSMIYELNEIGSLIWHICKKYIKVEEIIKKIGKEYQIKENILKNDLFSFFEKNSFLFKFK